MNNTIHVSLLSEDEHNAREQSDQSAVETFNETWEDSSRRRASQIAGSTDRADAILTWAKQPGAMDDESRAAVSADLGSGNPHRRDNAMTWLRLQFEAQEQRDIEAAGGFTSFESMREAMEMDRQQHGDVSAVTKARIAATPDKIVRSLR